jgi:cathepsin X
MSDRLNMKAYAAFRRAPAPRIELSAQHLLNCLPNQRRCGYPGSAHAAYEYVAKHGIPDESCAPYENTNHTCDALHLCAKLNATAKRINGGGNPLQPVNDPVLYYVDSNTHVPNNITAIQEAIFSGPVTAGIHVSGALRNYTGGILTDTDNNATSGSQTSCELLTTPSHYSLSLR